MRFDAFVGPTYASQSSVADAERAINWYPEVIESGTGKNRLALYRTPGLSLYCTLPEAPVRGLWAGGDAFFPRLFAAGGSHQYEIFNSGFPYQVEPGSIGNDGLPVSMWPNGQQLLIISAGQAYVNTGSGPAACAFNDGSGLVTAISGGFLDGFGIAARPQSKQYNISGLNDFTNWDPLNFASKQAYPDHLQAVLTDHEELYLLGDNYSCEIWRNEGNPDFPFQRDPSGFVHQACCARYSAFSLADSAYFLARDTRGGPTFVRMQGFQPVRVSNHAVEQAWQSYPTVTDCEAFPYVDKGHPFGVLNFPSGNATWVYDPTTNMWHERGWWNGTSLDRHRARCHAFAFGKHFVGDWQNGNIYVMDSQYLTDAGTPIHRIRTSPYITNEARHQAHHRFHLEMQGSGTVTATLEFSDDSAKTWSNLKYAAWSPTADKRNGLQWRRLGNPRSRSYRVTITDAVDVALINAYINEDPGVS